MGRARQKEDEVNLYKDFEMRGHSYISGIMIHQLLYIQLPNYSKIAQEICCTLD